MDWKTLFHEKGIVIGGMVLLLLLLLLVIFFSVWEKEEVKKKKAEKGFLVCPIRGVLRARKYDVRGGYTEEYQRIKLIKHLLQKGYPKSQFVIEYAIPIGHKGYNALRVDLVIKEQKKFICVAEVKKGYTKENMRSAIKHQLIPAMRIVNAKYGIYFDGTKRSRLLSRNNDGTLSIREFPSIS